MRDRQRRIIAKLGAASALLLGLQLVPGTAWAQDTPISIAGAGEAIVGPSVSYYGRDDLIRIVRSFSLLSNSDTVGNRITFTFYATADAQGKVKGEMQFIDHRLGLAIQSDVATLGLPAANRRPLGIEKGLVAAMNSSTGGVTVNGVLRAGYRFINQPTFDSGEAFRGAGDTVCFEVFDANNQQLYQWSAFLASGDVQIQAAPPTKIRW